MGTEWTWAPEGGTGGRSFSLVGPDGASIDAVTGVVTWPPDRVGPARLVVIAQTGAVLEAQLLEVSVTQRGGADGDVDGGSGCF